MKEIKILLLLLISTISYGQTINKEILIGVWKVRNMPKKVKNMPSEFSTFLKASFDFQENNKFILTSEVNEVNKMMKNSCWHLDSIKSEIVIQKCGNKHTQKNRRMTIKFIEMKRKTYFILLENSLFLEVSKN